MPFIGRERELDSAMREVVLALETCTGRSLFVSGLAGAGKSAFAAELLERVSARFPGVRIARGRCLQSLGCADPYQPFITALDDISDESTSGWVRRDTVAELVTELAPYWLSVVPLVGGLLSATVSTAAALRGKRPEVAPSREALFVQYLQVLKTLAGEAPLVLLLNDLHWADPSSVALLSHLSRGVASLPVVIVGTLRTDEVVLERHPIGELIRELEREELGRRLELGELPAEELGRLLELELGGELGEPLRRLLVETAGGNPLFATELCRLLVQNGSAVRVRGEWQLRAGAEEPEVPRSAEAVVEQRIARLDAGSLRLLQYASIEGNQFHSTVLARLLEEDELEVLDRLETLERTHHLVCTVGEVELADGDVATLLRFGHALVQTVLYRQVLGKRRLLLHRRAGEALEEMRGDDLEAVANQLARHFHAGRAREPAYRYACMAAELASRVHGHWEAEQALRIALEHAPGVRETVDVQERLGDVYHSVGYGEQSLQSYEAALRELSGGEVQSIRLRRKVIRAERKLGLATAPALLGRVRALLTEAAAHPVERCQLLIDASSYPDTPDPVATAAEALALAERQPDALLLLEALERLVVAHLFSGSDTGEAFPHLARGVALVRELDDPARAAFYHNLAGIAHAKLGRYDAARAAFAEMLTMAERTGNPQTVANAGCNLGCLLLRLGRHEEAEAALEGAHRIHTRRGNVLRAHSLLNLAERARQTGELPLAIERYTQLVELTRGLEYWDAEAVAHAGLGLSLLAASRTDEARAHAGSVVANVADHDRWFEDRDLVELFLARLEVVDGHRTEALQRLSGAAARLAGHDVYLWARLELERAEILAAGEPDEAAAIAARVAAAIAEVESPPLHRRLQALSGAVAGAEPALLQPEHSA